MSGGSFPSRRDPAKAARTDAFFGSLSREEERVWCVGMFASEAMTVDELAAELSLSVVDVQSALLGGLAAHGRHYLAEDASDASGLMLARVLRWLEPGASRKGAT